MALRVRGWRVRNGEKCEDQYGELANVAEYPVHRTHLNLSAVLMGGRAQPKRLKVSWHHAAVMSDRFNSLMLQRRERECV